MRATVEVAASRIIPDAPSWLHQVELKRISVLSASRTLKTWALYVSAFSAICSGVRGGRVALRPLGSPIIPVKSPMRNITWCPRSWSWRILFSTTVWPRCRSGAVGSNPAFTRRGLPLASLRTRSSSTISSWTPRRMTSRSGLLTH